MSTYPVVRMVECRFCKGKVRADDATCRWCQSPLKPQQSPPPAGQRDTPKLVSQSRTVSWNGLDPHYGEHFAWKTLLSPGQSVVVGEGEGAAQVQGGSLLRSLPFGTSPLASASGDSVSLRPLGVLFTKTNLLSVNWGQSEMATGDGILVGASGTMTIRQSDPVKLLSVFPQGQSYLSVKDLKALISRLIGSVLERIISQLKWLNLLVGGKKQLAESIASQLRAQLVTYGLELSDLEVSSIMLPDELRRALKERGIKELETRAELEKLEQMRRAGYDVNKLALMGGIAEKGGGVHLVEGNYVQGTNITADDSVFVRPDFSGRQTAGQTPGAAQSTVLCPRCDKRLDASLRLCPDCGTRFLACPTDGTTVIATVKAKFCHQCGGPLG